MLNPVYLGTIKERFDDPSTKRASRRPPLFRRLVFLGLLITVGALFLPSVIHGNLRTQDAEDYCLAATIYHESRGEIFQGQVAVAQVVLNRMRSPRWPDDACQVVKASRQFSWYQDSLPDKMTDPKAKDQAFVIAWAVLEGRLPDPTEGAKCYVRQDIRRHWMRGLSRRQIGNHIFLNC